MRREFKKIETKIEIEVDFEVRSWCVLFTFEL